MTNKELKMIIKTTILNGGATINLLGDSPKKGFMVATEGNEKQIKVSQFNHKTLKKYLAKNKEELKGKNKFIGTWINEGIVYVDISERIVNKDRAIELGKDRKQLAIFNIKTFEEVML